MTHDTSPVVKAARRLERRAFLAVWLAETARWLLVFSFVAGALVLLMRAGWRWSAAEAAPFFALLLIAPTLGFVRARARRLTPQDAATWLDVRSSAGGALVTGVERPDARWAAEVESALSSVPSLPRPKALRPGLSSSFGLAFAVLALQIRIPEPEVETTTELFEAQVERLAEKLDTLEEVVELDEEVAAEMERRLDELAEHLDAENFESTYEALDRMEERLAEEAQKISESAERANEHMQDAVDLAGSDANEAQGKMEEALAKMRDAGLGKELPSALRESFPAGSLSLAGSEALDAAEMMELSDSLRELMEGKLEGLTQAGLMGKHPGLKKPGKLASLSDFKEHVCSEECDKPGGT